MSKEIVEKELNKCFRESTLFRMFEFLQTTAMSELIQVKKESDRQVWTFNVKEMLSFFPSLSTSSANLIQSLLKGGMKLQSNLKSQDLTYSFSHPTLTPNSLRSLFMEAWKWGEKSYFLNRSQSILKYFYFDWKKKHSKAIQWDSQRDVLVINPAGLKLNSQIFYEKVKQLDFQFWIKDNQAMLSHRLLNKKAPFIDCLLAIYLTERSPKSQASTSAKSIQKQQPQSKEKRKNLRRLKKSEGQQPKTKKIKKTQKMKKPSINKTIKNIIKVEQDHSENSIDQSYHMEQQESQQQDSQLESQCVTSQYLPGEINIEPNQQIFKEERKKSVNIPKKIVNQRSQLGLSQRQTNNKVEDQYLFSEQLYNLTIIQKKSSNADLLLDTIQKRKSLKQMKKELKHPIQNLKAFLITYQGDNIDWHLGDALALCDHLNRSLTIKDENPKLKQLQTEIQQRLQKWNNKMENYVEKYSQILHEERIEKGEEELQDQQ